MAVGNLTKGHFLQFHNNSADVKQFVFQFNPETLNREKVFNTRTGQSSEQIKFRLIFDASTLFEQNNPLAELSILPFISALELLINQQQSDTPQGFIARIRRPKLQTFIGFSWGKRVFPVMINKMTILEPLFSPQLNPIYTKIDLVLSVLTIQQLKHNKQAVKLYYDFQNSLNSEASKVFSSLP